MTKTFVVEVTDAQLALLFAGIGGLTKTVLEVVSQKGESPRLTGVIKELAELANVVRDAEEVTEADEPEGALVDLTERERKIVAAGLGRLGNEILGGTFKDPMSLKPTFEELLPIVGKLADA